MLNLEFIFKIITKKSFTYFLKIRLKKINNIIAYEKGISLFEYLRLTIDRS
jgi:hypothetical protein